MVQAEHSVVADTVTAAVSDPVLSLGDCFEHAGGPVAALNAAPPLFSRLSGNKHHVHTGVVIILPKAVGKAKCNAWQRPKGD